MLDFGFYNMDCMEGMKEFPDNFFDLAIVDPPYGINVGKASMGIGGGVAPHLNRSAKNIKIGGRRLSAEQSPSERIKVGGGLLSAPKSTRRSMTATHRTPHISPNWHEWQKRESSGEVITFLSI